MKNSMKKKIIMCFLAFCILISGCAAEGNAKETEKYKEISIINKKTNQRIYIGQSKEELECEDGIYLGSSCIHAEFEEDKVSVIGVSASEPLKVFSFRTGKGIKLGDSKKTLVKKYGEPNSIADVYGRDNLSYYFTPLQDEYIQIASGIDIEPYGGQIISVDFLMSDKDIITSICIHELAR